MELSLFHIVLLLRFFFKPCFHLPIANTHTPHTNFVWPCIFKIYIFISSLVSISSLNPEVVTRSAPVVVPEAMEQGREFKASDSKDKVFSHVTVGSGARQGAKQWQEDSYAPFNSTNNKVIIGGIWDGHGGYNGRLASRTARDTTLNYFEEFKTVCETWTVEEWKKHLITVFDLAHTAIRQAFINETKQSLNQSMQRVIDEKGIVRSTAGDPVHGGTTATVVVCIRPTDPEGDLTIVTANCGDSTGLVVNLADRSPSKENFAFLTEVK